MDRIANRNLHIYSNRELEFSHTRKKRVIQIASNVLIVMRKTMLPLKTRERTLESKKW
jgi:hypothetical protein